MKGRGRIRGGFGIIRGRRGKTVGLVKMGKKGLTLPYMFYCICLMEEKVK